MVTPKIDAAKPPVKIISLNARGLNIREKLSQLLSSMHRNKADIIFLQETHFCTDSTPKLYNYHFPTVYHATNSTTLQKGVSILIANRCPFQISNSLIDAEGRYLFLKGSYLNRKITLANIYALNSRQIFFFNSLSDKLSTFTEGTFILGSDFNAPI